MYIRQISRKNKDGTTVRYLQLAQKVRDSQTGIPRDDVLYHFGREDQIDREQLKRLISSLSRFLGTAERTAVQASLDSALDGELTVGQPLSYGGTYALDALWRRLKLDETFKKLLEKRAFAIDVERLIFAMVANRALEPRSKLAIERWVGSRVAIDGCDEVNAQQLYRAMDFLFKHEAEIQKTVFFSVASLLNLEVDLLFFDTTSTYFETDEVDESDTQELRRYGHSKDHRPDLPQVVIGLAVTRQGIPVRCWVVPGNTADATMVKRVQEDLAGWRLNRVVWVMDRGFAGEEQRVALQRGGGHVIMGEKLRGSQAANHEALSRPGRFKTVRENLEVKEVEVEHGSEKRRFIVVRNPAQEEKDKALREKTIERLEEKLKRVNTMVQAQERGCVKAACALKDHATYGRYLRELKTGELRIDRAKVAEEEKLDGKYLLSVTDPALTAEDAALGYKQLLEVERAFRTLKTTLELRPVYHWLPERIHAHVLLCWLALLLVRVIELETGSTWERIRDELSGISLVPLSGKDGSTRACSELSPIQLKLLKDLKIDPPKRFRDLASTPSNP